MKYFILLLLIHQFIEETNQAHLFLINDPTNIYYTPYRVISSNYRFKRQISSLSYPELNQSCDPHVYTKLSSCSHLNDCS